MHLPSHPLSRLVARLCGCLAVAAAVMAGVRAPAGEPVACDQPDVWLVSTRRLPCIGRMPESASFHVERRGDGRWEQADLAGLFDDPSRPLVVFIHGNRYEPHDAKAQGVMVARQLARICPTAADARTVVFSWPSAQQGHLIRSSRDNFRRSYADAHYLARLLADADPNQHVAVIGYSFGATIAVGAMEDLVLAGDTAAHRGGPWVGRPGRAHLVLVAPAVRFDALAPRGPFAAAAAGIDRLTLVINSRDLALRLFPHLDREETSDALGVVGMPRRWLPGEVEFTATDAAPVVGKRHSFPLYLEAPGLARRIATGAVAGLGAE
jgi:hypothetical protein